MLRDVRTILIFIIMFNLLVTTAITHADELENQRKALELITSFADRNCKEAPIIGKQNSTVIEGEVKASLKSLISKIADLGVKGAGKYKTSEYEGVLQQDLRLAINDTNNCRVQVLNILSKSFIGKNGTTPTKKNNKNNTTAKIGPTKTKTVENTLMRAEPANSGKEDALRKLIADYDKKIEDKKFEINSGIMSFSKDRRNDKSERELRLEKELDTLEANRDLANKKLIELLGR